MPQKIENKDIFSPDFLQPQIKSFKELLNLIKLMESELKDVLKVQQQLVKTSDKKSVEGLNKRKKAITSVNQVSKEMLKLEKQRKSVSAQLAISETKEAKAIAASRIELARKKKAVKDEIIAEKGLIGEYQKQSARLNDLRKKYKDLILVQGKETRQTRKMRSEINRLDKSLRRVDATTGQFQRNVGNYPKVFGTAGNALRSMGLAVGGLMIIRDVFSTVKDFEQSIANLSSITGATGKNLDFFKEKAIELGTATTLSAGQVAEGFKLIASAKPELLEDAEALALVTEQAIILAEAAGIDLPTAAESLALSLNQFGAGADEASKFIDVLAAGSKKGAGDVGFLNGALLKVGGTAQAAGLSFVDTVAVLETLAPVLGSGEEAGTKFRNILANLQKEGLGFASGQFNINEAIAETNEMLNAIQDPAAKAAARIKLFGKQNDAAGIQLLNNTAALEAFQVSLDENGIALDQQKVNNDTLQGSLLALKSAWQGFILDLEQGTGFFSGLKDVILSVARNFTTIVKVIKTAAIAWGSYRIALMLVNAETGKFKRFGLISFFRKLVLGLKGLAKGGKSAALSLKGIGTAMKSIPLVAWIAGITTALSLIWDLVDGTDQATKEQNRLNDELREEIRLRKQLSDLRRTELAGITERVQAISKLSAAGVGQLVEDITGEIGKLKLELDDVNSTVNKFEEQSANAFTTWGEGGAAVQQTADGMFEVNDLVQDARKNSEILTETQSESKDELEKQLSVLQDQLKIVKDFKPLNKSNNKVRSKAIKNISKENELLKKQNKLKKDAFDTTQIIGQQEQEQLNESIKLKENAAEKELALQLEIAANKPEEVNVDELERLLNQRFDLIKRALEDERDLLLLNEELTDEQIELINTQFNNKLAENERNRIKTIDDANNTIIEGQIQASQKLSDIETERRKNDDAKRKKQQQDQLKELDNFAKKAIEIADAKTNNEIANIDEEIKASKAREKELETLAAQGNLTAEQSIGAEIKREAELERQKEALEKKKARRQIILEGLGLLSSKIDNGEKDAVTSTLNDMTRLLGALAALPGFIDGTETTVGAALGKPQLNTGVDDYIVRVDGSEKILNPNMSARTGNMTTEEITRAAEMYSSGMFDQNLLIHPQINALNQPFQGSNEILKKFDSLESTIRNKPILSDLKFDDLQKALIVTVEQNGDLKRAHYKLK